MLFFSKTVATFFFFAFLLLTIGWSGCNNYDDVEVADALEYRAAVIAGKSDPGQLQFDLTPEEQNAIVANRYLNGEWFQGCTANVISDRLAVSAAHCVLANYSAWQNGGEPVALAPEELTFEVGPDTDNALCTLSASQIHIHPDAHMADGWMYNDVSVVVLANPVSTTCPQITPIPVGRDALTVSAIGSEMLQGGYGSLDGSYDFSPIRYWSRLAYLGQYSSTPDSMIWFRDTGSGAPTFGDSGSGILHADSNGELHIVGVCSMTADNGGETIHGFTRMTIVTDLIDTVAASVAACEQVANGGACEGDIRVTCGAQGVEKHDCSDDQKICDIVDATAQCVDVASPQEDDSAAGCQSLASNTSIHSISVLLTLFFCRRRASSTSACPAVE